MPKLPVFKGKELIKFLEYLGFEVTRTKGSHSRLKSDDGRATSIQNIEEINKVYPDVEMAAHIAIAFTILSCNSLFFVPIIDIPVALTSSEIIMSSRFVSLPPASFKTRAEAMIS